MRVYQCKGGVVSVVWTESLHGSRPSKKNRSIQKKTVL